MKILCLRQSSRILLSILILVLAQTTPAFAQFWRANTEKAPLANRSERLMEGVIPVSVGRTNKTFKIALLKSQDRLYLKDEDGDCYASLSRPPEAGSWRDSQYILNYVQSDTCGLSGTIDWLVRYGVLNLLPCPKESCTHRTIGLSPRGNWPGTLEAYADLAILKENALDTTDRVAPSSKNVRSMDDTNELILAPYPVLYLGTLEDDEGRQHAFRIYEIVIGHSSKPSLHLYETTSGCMTPLHPPKGIKYDAYEWSSHVNPSGATIETDCNPKLRLSSRRAENSDEFPYMSRHIGRLDWIMDLETEGVYQLIIQPYRKFGNNTGVDERFAQGEILAVSKKSMFPPPAEAPPPPNVLPIEDYPPQEGLVYKKRDFWAAYAHGGVLAKVFNGDFKGLRSKKEFHGYLVSYVDEYYRVCRDYLPPNRITYISERWKEDEYGRVEDYYKNNVSFDPNFNGLYQKSLNFQEAASGLEAIGAVFDGLMIGGERGIRAIYYGISSAASDVFEFDDQIASFLSSSGCQSTTVTQLEKNFIRAASGKESLQSAQVTLAGAQAESDPLDTDDPSLTPTVMKDSQATEAAIKQREQLEKAINQDLFGIIDDKKDNPSPPAQHPVRTSSPQKDLEDRHALTSGSPMQQYEEAQKQRSQKIQELQRRAAESRIVTPDELAPMIDGPKISIEDSNTIFERQESLADRIQGISRKHYETQQESAQRYQEEIQEATSVEQQQEIRQRYQKSQTQAAREMQEKILDTREEFLDESPQDATAAYQRQQIQHQREQLQQNYQEADQRMEKAERLQEISNAHVQRVQEALATFQKDMQSATTQEERARIQQQFRDTKSKSAEELQQKMLEIRSNP